MNLFIYLVRYYKSHHGNDVRSTFYTQISHIFLNLRNIWLSLYERLADNFIYIGPKMQSVHLAILKFLKQNIL